MPTEVISLVSPSPPSSPAVGIKRRSSHQPRHNDNDFLFSDDDFNTTGDLDGSLCKKPRTSAASYRVRKIDTALPQKTKSAAIGSSVQIKSQPLGMKRRGHVVEGIEFSSSPVHPGSSDAARNAPEIAPDSFLLPRNSQVRKQQPTGVVIDNEPQRSTKATFIDLSGDPIESPPQRRSQPNPSRLEAAWDPISSSARESHDIQDLLSSPGGGASLRSPPRVMISIGSDSDDSDDLPDLGDVDFSKVRARKRSSDSSSRLTTKAPRQQSVKKASKSAEEKEQERQQKLVAREAEKKNKLAAKEAEKKQKRIEKERAKAQKEMEKALVDVNKLRTDKKISTPEMIVDIPASISEFLKVQIEAVLDDIGAAHETWDSTVQDVVKWRRKVASRFNKDLGFWEPVPMRVEDEDHVMVIIRASEFVELILGEKGRDLETHVSRMTEKFPNAKLIYLIEGLTPWMRKNRNLLNRQFASAVRSFGAPAEPESSSSRRRNNNQHQEYVDDDKIEDALLSLQVLHGALIHHTNAPIETAQWIGVFTQHISTIPYRRVRDANVDAGFCMESGQVRTGDGPKDTYVLMLQKITRVTPPIAYGIAQKYKSVTDLIRGFEKEGVLALAECYRSANKDGSLTDRTIGPALSKRVYKVFLGQDPASTDV